MGLDTAVIHPPPPLSSSSTVLALSSGVWEYERAFLVLYPREQTTRDDLSSRETLYADFSVQE